MKKTCIKALIFTLSLWISTAAPAQPLANGLTAIFSATGKFRVSADGAGSNSNSLTIRVNKPSPAATVYKAFFMSTSTTVPLTTGCITLAGNPITWDGSVINPFDNGTYNFYNYWADVTSIVAPIIDPLGAGISTIPIHECTLTSLIGSQEAIEGESLVVVFFEPATSERTVLVTWGGLDPLGDSYGVILGPMQHRDIFTMGLGISHSQQSNGSNDVTGITYQGTGYALVQTLSSCAGGEDDGGPLAGMLITVGGIGDTIPGFSDSPSGGTGPRCDCEHYDLSTGVSDSAATVGFNTANPSNNSNAFMCYFAISGSMNILNGTGIILAHSESSGCIGTQHLVLATVMNSQGGAVPGLLVNFTVTSGPNAGITGSSSTNIYGQASFTYNGNGGIGTDLVQACFIPVTGGQPTCSNVLLYQWNDCTACIPTLSQWGLIILGLLLLAAEVVFVQRRRVAFVNAGTAETSAVHRSLFDSRNWIITWSALLVITGAIFTIEILLSVPVTITDLAGSLVSSAILAYILHFFVPSRKERR